MCNLLSKSIKFKIYYSFPAVLYGRESYSFTSREEHRLRVFEKRVLRGLFGPKRESDRRLEETAY
jgi:hypothetical protein